MTRLVALRQTTYAGVTYNEGAKFDASDEDAKYIIAVEHAKLAPTPDEPPAPDKPAAPSDQPASKRADDAEAGGDAPVSAPKKRRYMRRDMVADK